MTRRLIPKTKETLPVAAIGNTFDFHKAPRDSNYKSSDTAEKSKKRWLNTAEVKDEPARAGLDRDEDVHFGASGDNHSTARISDVSDDKTLPMERPVDPSNREAPAAAPAENTLLAAAAMPFQARRKLEGTIDEANRIAVKGWVWDPGAPGDRIRLKVFDGDRFGEARREAGKRFRVVHIMKPKASRSESSELYLLCLFRLHP